MLKLSIISKDKNASHVKAIIKAAKLYNLETEVVNFESINEIKHFATQVVEFMELNQDHIAQATQFNELDLDKAFELEKGIDASRKELRKTSTKRIQEEGNVKAELLFMDVLKNFERIGDYSLNISQALRGIRGN